MNEIAWLGLGLLIGVIWIAGAFYVIIEWVHSDARPGSRRPWHRRRREDPPDESSLR